MRSRRNIVLQIMLIAAFFLVIINCSDDGAPTQIQDDDSVPAGKYLAISNEVVSEPNTTGNFRTVTFDISCENSGQTPYTAGSWDAAWIFIKYNDGDGEWRHATLSTISTEHTAPEGVTITSPEDGKGVFINYGENGDLDASGVSLRWNYGQDGVEDNAAVTIKVLGIEMVYIPEGSFYAGDNCSSLASFRKGSEDNSPWHITSEDAIEVTDTASDGYYYFSSRDILAHQWNIGEDETGSSFTIPADFPKGYRALYCMKYEMTEQQYVDFLNLLNPSQTSNRYDAANYNDYGYTIHYSNGEYSTQHPHRVCGFICPADGFAYADWSGLRPMTELEFEKICRGSNNQPVEGEFAWGTTNSSNVASYTGSGDDTETITNSDANCYFEDTAHNPYHLMPAGIFARPGSSRELSGASYYGVMEMSGNVNELCITVGNQYGRAFTHVNGDGQLGSDGSADESNWPGNDGRGSGYRGGCLAQDEHTLQVSDRMEANVVIENEHRHIPWGFRGVRTVYY